MLRAVLFAATLAVAAADNTNLTNYERQAPSIEYNKELGLPPTATLDGTITELDPISSRIVLNRTQAELSCAAGYMHIKLNLDTKFYGIVYADFDRNSVCKLTGDGSSTAEMKLPLKGCGTLESPARVFTNNIVVRFHPDLEIDGDEVITIICRYPPPIVPPPAAIPLPVVVPPAATPLRPLREFEILLIICAIIFLALMLLGIGCSYYCLKKRNIKVVRRRPASTLGSDITKVSEPPSMFNGLKIPRAQAMDASGSEEMTESVNTDFHSDINSVMTEDEYTSAYSDKMCILPEGAVRQRLAEPPAPNFDIKMLVKEREMAYTPEPSVISSGSDSMLQAQEQYLTTILERTETNTLETLERSRQAKAKHGPPPVHARINVHQKEVSDVSDNESFSEYSQAGTEVFSDQDMELETRHMKNFSIVSAANLERDLQPPTSGSGRRPPSMMTTGRHHDRVIVDEQTIRGGIDRRIDHRTDLNLDERHFHSQNVSETHHTTSSHFETDTRETTTGVRAREELIIQPVIHRTMTSDLNVVTSAGGPRPLGPRPLATSGITNQRSEIHREISTGRNINSLNNFDVLIRVIDAPADGFFDQDEVSSVFTEEERTALREVLNRDVTMQQDLRSTFTREQFRNVFVNHSELRSAIPEQKWDVLIRILNNRPIAALEYDDIESRSNTTVSEGDIVHRQFREGGSFVMENRGYLPSDLESRSAGTYSVADRSAAEITEYHTFKSGTAYEWKE